MGEWTTERLEDCLDALIDYRGKSPIKAPTGIPVLSAKVVKTSGLVRPIEQTIAIDYYSKWMTRGLPRPGDIVMTTEAPMGEVIQLDTETAQFALGQRIVCLRGKRGKLDNTFLRYLLTSSEQQKLLASYATGTTVLGISQKALRSVPISYPTYSEQVQIGELLSALDDKIELNRRMNETLEASARALFRHWFVDFGPTRAKAEGHPAYLAPDLWSLFPDRLGEDGVPEGWTVGMLSDLMEVSPSEPLKRGTIAPYLDMAAIPTAGPNPDQPVSREYGSGTRFRNGDTLLARITPCLENGKTAFVQNLPEETVGWGSTEFIVLRSKSPVPAAASYLLARDSDFRRHAIRSMTGTSGRQRADASAIAAYPVSLPGDGKLWSRLGKMIDPLFDRIAFNAAEAKTLAATRDALLPKLMSGETRVSDVDTKVIASL